MGLGQEKVPRFSFSKGKDTRKVNYVFNISKTIGSPVNLPSPFELTLRDYTICVLQRRLTDSQKADYFVNILDGDLRIASVYLAQRATKGTFLECMNEVHNSCRGKAVIMSIMGDLHGIRTGTGLPTAESGSIRGPKVSDGGFKHRQNKRSRHTR